MSGFEIVKASIDQEAKTVTVEGRVLGIEEFKAWSSKACPGPENYEFTQEQEWDWIMKDPTVYPAVAVLDLFIKETLS